MEAHAVDSPTDGCHLPHDMHKHGAFDGHVLPGSFFVVWSVWWTFIVIARQLHAKSTGVSCHSRSWYQQPFAKQTPLEPYIKIFCTFVGMTAEISWGHGRYMPLYAENEDCGYQMLFVTHNIHLWQHFAMYGAFFISGVVDLMGTRLVLLEGSEMVFLLLAYLSEALLMVFHLKGSPLEFRVHLLLALVMFSTVAVILLEMAFPRDPVLQLARGATVMLQGTWFIQIGYILFKDLSWWREDYMGSAMVVPIFFVGHMIGCFFAVFAAYIFLSHQKVHNKVQLGDLSNGELDEDEKFRLLADGKAKPMARD